jgi:hypothetical protein
LFAGVSRHLSRTLLALVIASVPIAFVIVFNEMHALLALKESYMAAFDQMQQYAQAMANLRMYDNGIIVIGFFWGLWLIPFGLLVYRSKFVPKLFGILLIIGGVSYLVDVTAFILLPPLQPQTNILVSVTSLIAEVAMVLWLLIGGRDLAMNPCRRIARTSGEQKP